MLEINYEKRNGVQTTTSITYLAWLVMTYNIVTFDRAGQYATLYTQ